MSFNITWWFSLSINNGLEEFKGTTVWDIAVELRVCEVLYSIHTNSIGCNFGSLPWNLVSIPGVGNLFLLSHLFFVTLLDSFLQLNLNLDFILLLFLSLFVGWNSWIWIELFLVILKLLEKHHGYFGVLEWRVNPLLEGDAQVLFGKLLELFNVALLIWFESEVSSVNKGDSIEWESFNVIHEAMTNQDYFLLCILFKLVQDAFNVLTHFFWSWSTLQRHMRDAVDLSQGPWLDIELSLLAALLLWSFLWLSLRAKTLFANFDFDWLDNFLWIFVFNIWVLVKESSSKSLRTFLWSEAWLTDWFKDDCLALKADTFLLSWLTLYQVIVCVA